MIVVYSKFTRLVSSHLLFTQAFRFFITLFEKTNWLNIIISQKALEVINLKLCGKGAHGCVVIKVSQKCCFHVYLKSYKRPLHQIGE